MADRVVESSDVQVPEVPEILEKVLLFSLEEAKEKMLQGEDVIPYTALVVKDNLFIENHPGETAEECFNFARHTVQNARGADAYALCYDGYVEIDDYAVGFLYEADEDGALVFEEEPAYIGEAPNFMVALKSADAYDDDEIDEKYLDDEDDAVEDDAEKPEA